MKLENEVFDEVVQFIHNEMGKVWWRSKPLTRYTRLYEDLRIDGDDATDLFLAFQKQFKVDLTALDLRKHFNDEGFDPVGISTFIRKITRQPPPPKKSSKPITLGDLENTIKRGKWIDP